MTGFASKWLTWAPAETPTGSTAKTAKNRPATLETPRVRTDKPAKRASVSFGSEYSTHSQENVAALGEAANEGLTVPVVQDADSADSADSLSPESNRATPETLRVGTAKTDKRWDAETAALIEWFLGTSPPAHPFELHQAVTIARPDKYWAYLRQDIAAGPTRARGKTGAFQENLRQLYRVLHNGNDIGDDT